MPGPRTYNPPLSRRQADIRDAMVGLLARAGLEYRGGFVEAGGRLIHYLDYGPEADRNENAPTLLLVHGAGAGAAVWFQQIAALSKHFRVVAPDNPLFGLSAQHAASNPIEDFTTDFLVSFIDSLGLQRVNVAGLSMGGLGCIFLAVRHPDRVSRLAVLSAAGLGSDMPWVMRAISVPGLSNLFTMPIRTMHGSYFASHEVARPHGPHLKAYKHYAFAIGRNDGHGPALRKSVKVVTDLRGQRRLLSDEELAGVKAPTLIIWGAKDRFFPLSHARRAARLIPNSILHVLPEAGHVTPWDEPDRVNGLLSSFFG